MKDIHTITMNRHILQQENRRLDAYYSNYDISNFIPQLQAQIILEKLIKNKLRFRQGQTPSSYSLICSQLTDTPLYKQILRELQSRYRNVDTFYFWNSEFTQNLLELLKRTVWTYRKMEFYSCQLGNETSLFSLKFDSLSHLVIHSDPIGNKGLKQLMKVYFLQLDTLIIGNTNITADGIRLLKKNPSLRLTNCGFPKQKDFNHDLYLRVARHFINQHPSGGLTFDYQPERREGSLFLGYLGHIAKFRIDFRAGNFIIFRVNKRQLVSEMSCQKFMCSRRALDNIRRVLDLCYQ